MMTSTDAIARDPSPVTTSTDTPDRLFEHSVGYD
jgi:hypothetical protein